MVTRSTIGSTNDPSGPGPQHFVIANTRELRAQSVHRLQIGLLGLAIMLLLVGLANIIMDRVKLADGGSESAKAAAASANKKAGNDPLAVIGAVPSPEASSVQNANLPSGR